MKRKWERLAAVVAAAIVCTLLPAPASAAQATRHAQIASIDLRKADKNDDRMSRQGWTWNHDKKLLTLHGVDIDSLGKGGGCILLPEEEDVTIQLIGRNTLRSGKSAAIALNGGSLTILTRTDEDETADPSLYVTTNGNAIAVTGGDLLINEGIFNIQSADAAFKAAANEEGSGGEIAIRGGTITAASDGVALQADAAIKVTGGSVTAVGSTAAAQAASISMPGMTAVEGGAVTQAEGGDWVTFAEQDVRWEDDVLVGASQKVVLQQPYADEDGEPGKPQDGEQGQTAPSVYFSDMQGHWAGDAVAYAVGRGLFSGTAEATFSPDMPITRGMAVTVLYRMQGSPAVYGTRPPYTDVAAGDYCAPAVIWAMENDIIRGTGNGTFSPDQSITREEFAAMLYNCRRAEGYSSEYSAALLDMYNDSAAVSTWARTAVADLVGAGLLSGKGDGRLDPQGTTTRAEAAAMLMRLGQQENQIQSEQRQA